MLGFVYSLGEHKSSASGVNCVRANDGTTLPQATSCSTSLIQPPANAACYEIDVAKRAASAPVAALAPTADGTLCSLNKNQHVTIACPSFFFLSTESLPRIPFRSKAEKAKRPLLFSPLRRSVTSTSLTCHTFVHPCIVAATSIPCTSIKSASPSAPIIIASRAGQCALYLIAIGSLVCCTTRDSVGLSNREGLHEDGFQPCEPHFASAAITRASLTPTRQCSGRIRYSLI